ncbi:MAG: hypothetical protein ACK6AD_04920 [Cyanobacteriota bacterium]|jgi:hypothetical protein
MFALTLPEKVIALLSDLYAKKSVVLEYGTGGSTFLALEANEGNTLFGCETDSHWLNRLCLEVALRGLGGRFFPIYQDIGATKEWGMPCFEKEPYTDARGIRMLQAPGLPWEVMNRLGTSPDVILIDGRFRVACFITCWANIQKPTTLIFDDYAGRPAYHVVEELTKPVEMVDRAAIFELTPQAGLLNIKEFLNIYVSMLVNPS